MTDRLTGFFETRRRRGFPWIGALVEAVDSRFVLSLDGELYPETWPECTREQLFAECIGRNVNAFSHPLLSIWLWGRPCDEAQYRYRLALSKWSRTHTALHPLARPDQPIDLGIVPLDFII